MRVGVVGTTGPDDFAAHIVDALARLGHDPVSVSLPLPRTTYTDYALTRCFRSQMRISSFVIAYSIALATLASMPLRADDGERLLSVDHYVRIHSTAPAIAGLE